MVARNANKLRIRSALLMHPISTRQFEVCSGYKWRLINDEPWKRAYVVFKEGADTQFVPMPDELSADSLASFVTEVIMAGRT